MIQQITCRLTISCKHASQHYQTRGMIPIRHGKVQKCPPTRFDDKKISTFFSWFTVLIIYCDFLVNLDFSRPQVSFFLMFWFICGFIIHNPKCPHFLTKWSANQVCRFVPFFSCLIRNPAVKHSKLKKNHLGQVNYKIILPSPPPPTQHPFQENINLFCTLEQSIIVTIFVNDF